MHVIFRLLAATGVVALTVAAGPDDASQAVLAQRGSVVLTAGDVRDLLARITPATRTQLQKNPAVFTELVRGRVLQLALLQEAQGKKWDQRPDIATQANQAHDQVIMDTYLASVSAPDPAYPSDTEVQQAYDANKQRFLVPRQYHLAQIYIAVASNAPKQASDDARKKLADLRLLAAKPRADFAELARVNSNDQSSAAKGGDLGWIREDQLAPQVKDAVTGLQEGGLSEPVQMPDGWHMMKLVGTQPASVAPLADVHDALVNSLRQQRTEQNGRDYLAAMQRSLAVQLNEIQLSRLLTP